MSNDNKGTQPAELVGEGPLIVRIAGLPGSWIEGLGSEALKRELTELQALENDLAKARSAMVDQLYPLVTGQPRDWRRFVLAVKRDCFNGRSIERHRTKPGWDELRRLTSPWADRLLELEASHRRRCDELDQLHEQELSREREHLYGFPQIHGVRRGLALASPLLLSRHKAAASRHRGKLRRREKRSLLTLLRYGSRTALKLSPYSTLTRLALGESRRDAPAPLVLRGSSSEWQESSRAYLRRYLLKQLEALLLLHEELRDSLSVQLNPTMSEVTPGIYRLVRPAAWQLPSKDEQQLAYKPLAAVQTKLSAPLIEWLRELLASQTWCLGEVVSAMAAALGANDTRGRVAVEKLVRVGALLLESPWEATDRPLEEALEEGLSADLMPADVATELKRLIELERSFAKTEDPARTAAEIQRALARTWSAARRPLEGQLPGLELRQEKSDELYEDVVLSHTGTRPPELVRVSSSEVAGLQSDLAPWFRLIDVHGPRYELLLGLGDLLKQDFPGGAGILDFWQAARPLWREYREFVEQTGSASPTKRPCFNPRELQEVEELHQIRKQVWAALRDRVKSSDTPMDPSELDVLVGRLSPCYRPRVGPCLFVQPADGLWVLNRIFEGTGRYSSRYTVAMPEGLRGRLTDAGRQNSRIEENGETIELVDLLSIQGESLNVHIRQTERVLSMPGEGGAFPPEQCLQLEDLRIEPGVDGLPVLVDRKTERKVLPVFLGGAALLFAPPLVQFLATLGVGEQRPIPPPRRRSQEGDVEILERLVLGRVVLERQRWVVPTESLVAAVSAGSGADLSLSRAFVAVDRWRRQRELPDHVFVIERVRHPVAGFIYKPQYLDFTSPSFVVLLQAILDAAGPRIVFEEALPDPKALPVDESGERWAAELQIDALPLSAGSARTGEAGADR